jgi:predicted alpha/beta-fold hydrolase
VAAEGEDATVVTVEDGLERGLGAVADELDEALVGRQAQQAGGHAWCNPLRGPEDGRCIHATEIIDRFHGSRNPSNARNGRRLEGSLRVRAGRQRNVSCMPRHASFEYGGHRFAYTEHGSGPRVTVLLHGLLLSQRMQGPLAAGLAERGHRVVTLDLLGHGRSDRPPEMWRYSMPEFGRETIALLDHLEVEEAVVFGTSLGANATL